MWCVYPRSMQRCRIRSYEVIEFPIAPAADADSTCRSLLSYSRRRQIHFPARQADVACGRGDHSMRPSMQAHSTVGRSHAADQQAAGTNERPKVQSCHHMSKFSAVYPRCSEKVEAQGKTKLTKGLLRELNPGPLAPEARIIPLDQAAGSVFGAILKVVGTIRREWESGPPK